MGNKIYRLFEYAYIVMAIFSTYVAYDNWNENRNRAYLFVFFTVVAIFMFFFKRKFRKKMEERNQK
jgi:FtsH-binding integral membrane protein